MAQRRNVLSEKTTTQNGGGDASQSDIAPAVPASVIYKLLGFTVAMVAVPIGSYFATVNVVFRGNATYAGGLAAIMANVVLIAYILVAWNEDQSEKLAEQQKAKKAQ